MSSIYSTIIIFNWGHHFNIFCRIRTHLQCRKRKNNSKALVVRFFLFFTVCIYIAFSFVPSSYVYIYIYIVDVGILKRKKPSYMEHTVKSARTKSSKPQLLTPYTLYYLSILCICIQLQIGGELIHQIILSFSADLFYVRR